MTGLRDPRGLGRRFDPDAGFIDPPAPRLAALWPLALGAVVAAATAAAVTIGFGDLLLELWRRP